MGRGRWEGDLAAGGWKLPRVAPCAAGTQPCFLDDQALPTARYPATRTGWSSSAGISKRSWSTA